MRDVFESSSRRWCDGGVDGDFKKALRLCLKLGGETGSEALREWATLELNGYDGRPDTPDYRNVKAPLQIEGIRPPYKFSGQTIASIELADFARDVITEDVVLGQSAPSSSTGMLKMV